MTLRMRDWLGKLVSAPSGARVPELLAIVHTGPPRASRLCASRFICPNLPQEAPKGHPKHPKGLILAQSGTNVEIHIAQNSSKLRKMGQPLSKLDHGLQDGCPVGTNSPNSA